MPPRRPKVLVVAPDQPFPVDRAGRARLLELCRALKGRYSFHLLAFAPKELMDDPLHTAVYHLKLGAVFDKVRLVPWTGPPEDLWFRFWEPSVRDGESFRRMAEAVQAAVRVEAPDLVDLQHVQMLALRRYVWGPPVVFQEHDLGWMDLGHRLWERADGAPPLWDRLTTWARLRREYRRLGRSVQGVVTAGAEDLSWWRRWGPGGVPSACVNHGVHPEEFSPPERPAARPEILFTGFYPHPPNEEAARYFLREIWPRVSARAPKARVTFAGAQPPPWLLEARSERVRVPGFLPDLRPALRAAQVFVAPVRLGRGNKAKVVEAFAAGVPVVASPEALRGFPTEVRSFVRLGRTAAGFALETANLLENKRLRSEISSKARRWVEQNLSWKICAERLDAFYQTVLSNAPRGANGVFRRPD